MFWYYYKRTYTGQCVCCRFLHRNRNCAVIHNGIVIDQETVPGSQWVGYRRVFPEIIYGKGDIFCCQRCSVVKFRLRKQGKGIITAVYFPGLCQPWNIPCFIFINQACKHKVHLSAPRSAGGIQIWTGNAPVCPSRQLKCFHQMALFRPVFCSSVSFLAGLFRVFR